MSSKLNHPDNDILIVDDTAADLKLLSNILSDAEYDVRPASSADLALRSIKVKPPELILMDIKMPGMNGFELCNHLMADDKTKEIPVIFCSALGDGPHIKTGFDMGAVDYISKPFQSEEIISRVKMHLKIKNMQKELDKKVKKRTLELRQEIEKRIQIDQEKEKLILDLQKALKKVKQLSGLLPICSHCKKIRDDKGYWNQLESYFHEHSEVEFSHSICQECAKEHYPDLDIYDN